MAGANLEGLSSFTSAVEETASKWSETVVFSVGTNVRYAAFVEFGTKRHTIEADSGALKFTVGGTEVFAKSVEHPGSDPKPYLVPAAEEAERNLGAIEGDSVEDVLKKVAAFTQRAAQKNLVENGSVDTGNLMGSIRYRRVN